jgi:hypothetical protein
VIRNGDAMEIKMNVMVIISKFNSERCLQKGIKLRKMPSEGHKTQEDAFRRA